MGYAATNAAIRAIKEIKLDHYLMKPWDPPEERLYPVLDDLLSDWLASVPVPYDGIRVAGTLWSASSHNVKEFLARSQIPYKWLDIERDPEAKELVEATSEDGWRWRSSLTREDTGARSCELVFVEAHVVEFVQVDLSNELVLPQELELEQELLKSAEHRLKAFSAKLGMEDRPRITPIQINTSSQRSFMIAVSPRGWRARAAGVSAAS